MNVLEITGLKKEVVAKEVESLKILLADLQVFYTNLRGFHWHIQGPRFFELHKEFENMYDGISEYVDEVAERLLQLDVTPENRYSEVLKVSEVKEVSNFTTLEQIMPNLFETYKLIIARERELLELSDEAGDDVTNGFIAGKLEEQEKLMWMLTAMSK